MFIGTFYHNLETKGRLAIPAKFRRQLEKGGIVTRGLDKSLFIFPQAQWEKLLEKLSASPLSRADARAFIRLMTHEACEVEFDRQGRTLIPAYLLEYANLKKEVVVAGTLSRVEIWDKATYHAYIGKIEAKGDALAESLQELGI
jgi:MraZ protein